IEPPPVIVRLPSIFTTPTVGSASWIPLSRVANVVGTEMISSPGVCPSIFLSQRRKIPAAIARTRRDTLHCLLRPAMSLAPLAHPGRTATEPRGQFHLLQGTVVHPGRKCLSKKKRGRASRPDPGECSVLVLLAAGRKRAARHRDVVGLVSAVTDVAGYVEAKLA